MLPFSEYDFTRCPLGSQGLATEWFMRKQNRVTTVNTDQHGKGSTTAILINTDQHGKGSIIAILINTDHMARAVLQQY